MHAVTFSIFLAAEEEKELISGHDMVGIVTQYTTVTSGLHSLSIYTICRTRCSGSSVESKDKLHENNLVL